MQITLTSKASNKMTRCKQFMAWHVSGFDDPIGAGDGGAGYRSLGGSLEGFRE